MRSEGAVFVFGLISAKSSGSKEKNRNGCRSSSIASQFIIKSTFRICCPFPVIVTRQKRILCSIPGKRKRSFTNPKTLTKFCRVTRSVKKIFIVSSDAIPGGQIKPVLPLGFIKLRSTSAKTAYVLMSPRPVRGNRILSRRNRLCASAQ